MSEELGYRKWIPVIDGLIKQCYYRVLSFISWHGPVDEAYLAAKELAETKRGGRVYWVLKGRVFRWDDLEVYPGIKMSVWCFGGKIRRKNTVMARVGWWKLYLIDMAVKGIASVMGERP